LPVIFIVLIRLFQLVHRIHQCLGDILPAVNAVSSFLHIAMLLTAATAAIIFSLSFFPSVSTALLRSTPTGLHLLTASEILSGPMPPARRNGFSGSFPLFLYCSSTVQSNRSPVPPFPWSSSTMSAQLENARSRSSRSETENALITDFPVLSLSRSI